MISSQFPFHGFIEKIAKISVCEFIYLFISNDAEKQKHSSQEKFGSIHKIIFLNFPLNANSNKKKNFRSKKILETFDRNRIYSSKTNVERIEEISLQN